MEWWQWLLLTGVLALLVTWPILRMVRLTRRGRSFLGLTMEGKLRFGRYLLAKGGLPLPARVILVITVGYMALPLDFIPDFIPIVGQLDDFFVSTVAVLLLMQLVPPEMFDRAVRDAQVFSAKLVEPLNKPKELNPPQDSSQSTSP